MVLTSQQIQELHKMSLHELKSVHKQFKMYTKKMSKKEELSIAITEIVRTFEKIRCDLSMKYNCVIKPRGERDISNLTADDLRQIHTSFRHALRCGSFTKLRIICSLVKLSKQVDYFVQY